MSGLGLRPHLGLLQSSTPKPAYEMHYYNNCRQPCNLKHNNMLHGSRVAYCNTECNKMKEVQPGDDESSGGAGDVLLQFQKVSFGAVNSFHLRHKHVQGGGRNSTTEIVF